jgi:putative transposase
MSKSKHTEAQMIAALKQVEAGRKVEDVARECGVSKHTIYAWKAKYGGMDVSEAQEAKHLRDETAEPVRSYCSVSFGLPRYFCGSAPVLTVSGLLSVYSHYNLHIHGAA